MLTEICHELHNWFDSCQPEYMETFIISGGQLDIADKIQQGQYYRIRGSVFNDGVYLHDGNETLKDETFVGTVNLMANMDIISAVYANHCPINFHMLIPTYFFLYFASILKYATAIKTTKNGIGNIMIIKMGEFCSKTKNGIPNNSNTAAATNQILATALLYFFTSVTSGALQLLKKPAGFFDILLLIPIMRNSKEHKLHIIKANSILSASLVFASDIFLTYKGYKFASDFFCISIFYSRFINCIYLIFTLENKEVF